MDIGTTMADCRRFMEEQRVETQDIVFLRRFTKLHPEVTVRYSEIQEEEEQGEEEYSGEDAAPDPSHDVAATAGTGEPEPDFPQTVTTGPLPGDED